ncbi:RNA polymerase [Ralstonia phage RSB3]|uniref:DNA-directed RNA polymerase n=1 Tax=Ralstonia phage RSB3 TaxID=1402875 RepID=U3TFM9_9CAUD|nr:RNA polymerase [Ralstonia phage RSB3]BAN92342.1 putative phage RNA polymerase [Ralstonia phage RSB3]
MTQDAQLRYELESDAAAAAARLQELTEAARKGDAEAPRAQRLTGEMHKQVVELLQASIDTKTRGTGGKYKTWMRRLGAEKAALIAIRECIRCCTKITLKGATAGASAQMLTSNIGKLYELEVRIQEAEEVNPMYMEKIHEQVKDNGTKDYGHLRRLYNVAYDRVMKGELDSTLSDSEAAQVGKFGVDACYEAGLIKLLPSATVGMALYVLDEEIVDYLVGYDASDVHRIVDRGAGAMMCPPEPWTGLQDGGYLSARRKQQFPLMPVGKLRRSERKRIREMFTAEKMPLVFACANYLQSIPFEMHMPTFRAVERIWQTGGAAMGLPRKEKPVKPPFPFPDTWVKEDATEAELAAFVGWKRQATAYYTSLREWRGHVMEFGGFLKMARRAGERMWFPVMADTRGRWYYNGTPNPQGSDMAKATLHFADKKPLGVRGLFWLKVHIANSLGFDKVRMQQRADYVDALWPRLEAALDAPEDHAELWGTDAPWCAYAAAWELREALRTRNPETYETGLPVHMDATCSGLQHFSAILRDPVGGQYVNLYDLGGDAKQDIYRKTADVAMTAIAAGVDSLAKSIWLEKGISRNAAKKPVMTYVYGATLRGTAEFLEGEVLAGREDSKEKGERNCDIANVGAKALFAGIEGTVPAAANAMRWLKEVCRTVPKNTRMEWTAPTGFKVQHDYQKIEEVRVRINSCGINRIMFYEPLDECNPSQMQNAIAPNFVHALDASHLTFTALAMQKEGFSFVGIHDSFGTHPCDVDTLHRHIRQEFVSMYEKNDVLMDFLWEVGGTGEVPKQGNLDLRKILDSEFFFC